MYKTIRHGENSLQYTILPQNDDFRIEGKLSSNSNRLAAAANTSLSTSSATSSSSAGGAAAAGIAVNTCSSSSSSAHSGLNKRNATGPRKRRTFFAYLGLIFVCTVIIGAVLIPFLVSAECLPSPTEWFLKTKAAFTHSSSSISSKELQQQQQHIAAATVKPPTTVAVAMMGQNVGKTVQIVNRNGIEQFILKINKTTSSTSTTTSTTTSAPTTTEQLPPVPPTTLKTTTTTTIIPTTTLPPPATIAAAAPPLINRLIPATITTRIIQVPLLKSASKKPIMPPVLAKTQSTQQQHQHQQQQSQGNGEVSQNNKSNNNAWMNTHWAYIDPSTYVQWSGYKAEDSVLLPALLGFALIGMILIITVCLVARNKRTIVSSVRKRNRNDIEEQGAEDNATLLTTTNLSDDD